MLSRKGFTLVELLGVIVVLAILALITIPIISNVINDVRIKALRSSAYGLIEASNLYYAQYGVNNNTRFDIDNNLVSSTDTDNLLKYKGSVKSGVVILSKKGNVTVCVSDGKNAAYKNYNETQVTTKKGQTCSIDTNSYIVKLSEEGDTLTELSGEQLTSEIQDLKEEIQKLKEKNSELESKINTNEKSIGTNSGLITNLSSSVGTNTASISDLSSQVSTLQSNVHWNFYSLASNSGNSTNLNSFPNYSNGYTYSNITNTPSGTGGNYHILMFGVDNGNSVQMAIPARGGSIHIRTCVGGTWGSWTSIS